MHAAAINKKKAFTSLFLIELWERFGYYGMAVLLVLFMKDYLGFSDSKANLTWGAFAAMVYAVPTIGGWIGDRVLGAKRMTVIGGIVLGIGYLLLAIPGPTWLLFFALGVVAVGNGLFKANPANLISRVYEGDPARVDSAFTMYYMAVNVGALLSQFLTPIVRVNVSWQAGFAVCAAGMALGLINFMLMRRHLTGVGSAPDMEPLHKGRLVAVLAGSLVFAVLIAGVLQNLAVARAVVWAAGAVLLVIFAMLIARGERHERNGLIAVLLLTAQGMLYFIFYQQMSTSLTLFALRNVDLNFLGYLVPPEQFQLLNPFWIMVLSPLLAWLYASRADRGIDLPIATKFAIGFAMLSVAFFIYGLSGNFAEAGLVSAWWLIWGYFFISLGELLISGLGLAMVARYVGPNLRGFIMGAWFLATGISQYLGSVVANFASVPDDVTDPLLTLPLYTSLFMKLGAVAVGGTLIAFAMLPLMRRLSVHPETPAGLPGGAPRNIAEET
jgi:POT family proton-dependent oligopeptide transporter